MRSAILAALLCLFWLANFVAFRSTLWPGWLALLIAIAVCSLPFASRPAGGNEKAAKDPNGLTRDNVSRKEDQVPPPPGS